MCYKVRAERDAEPCFATRVQPSSAIVLALRWAEEGYKGIRIETATGRTFDIKAAQERLARGLRL